MGESGATTNEKSPTVVGLFVSYREDACSSFVDSLVRKGGNAREVFSFQQFQ